MSIGKIGVPTSKPKDINMFFMAKNLNPETLRKFITWLDGETSKRGLSDAQLAKKAGISHPVISKARSGIQPIGWEACVAIATALELPPDTVLIKAGLLPAKAEESPLNDEIIYLMGTLPLDDQTEILNIARMKLERQKNKNLPTNRNSGNPAPSHA